MQAALAPDATRGTRRHRGWVGHSLDPGHPSVWHGSRVNLGRIFGKTRRWAVQRHFIVLSLHRIMGLSNFVTTLCTVLILSGCNGGEKTTFSGIWLSKDEKFVIIITKDRDFVLHERREVEIQGKSRTVYGLAGYYGSFAFDDSRITFGFKDEEGTIRQPQRLRYVLQKDGTLVFEDSLKGTEQDEFKQVSANSLLHPIEKF